MAIMYPKDLSEKNPTESERLVFNSLKSQLPDSYEVFYSVQWSRKLFDGTTEKSEADFVVVSPTYGYICLEVKGGCGIKVEGDTWYIEDAPGKWRPLTESPYDQSEKSMYYFKDAYANAAGIKYPGIYGAAAIFPFYVVNDIESLSNRPRECTIDYSNMNELSTCILRIFKHWGGASFGRKPYQKQQHLAFVELVKKKVAISAAAGALVEDMERKLDVINRVQDNYIYFLSNVKQFYIRGGAGTGKTWIAQKMAQLEAKKGKKVLFLCASPNLANVVKGMLVGDAVDVMDVPTLFSSVIKNIESYSGPDYLGISNAIIDDEKKYNSIFIDEAQDFSEEWAYIVRLLLEDEKESRLGVFYDDVQIVRDNSFGDAFMIDTPPYLLRENIRNTANIYRWATENTDLGTEVIVNPIEGPVPVKEKMQNWKNLSHRLSNILKEYLVDEQLPAKSIAVLVNDEEEFWEHFGDGLAMWRFSTDSDLKDNEIFVSSVENFKGLEANMVIYIHDENTTDNIDYIAYTRARFYLLELVL